MARRAHQRTLRPGRLGLRIRVALIALVLIAPLTGCQTPFQKKPPNKPYVSDRVAAKAETVGAEASGTPIVHAPTPPARPHMPTIIPAASSTPPESEPQDPFAPSEVTECHSIPTITPGPMTLPAVYLDPLAGHSLTSGPRPPADPSMTTPLSQKEFVEKATPPLPAQTEILHLPAVRLPSIPRRDHSHRPDAADAEQSPNKTRELPAPEPPASDPPASDAPSQLTPPQDRPPAAGRMDALPPNRAARIGRPFPTPKFDRPAAARRVPVRPLIPGDF